MQSKDDDIDSCCIDMKTSQRDQSRKELGGITNDDGDAIFETQKMCCLKKTHNKRPKTPQICGKDYFENSKERGEVSSSSLFDKQ